MFSCCRSRWLCYLADGPGGLGAPTQGDSSCHLVRMVRRGACAPNTFSCCPRGGPCWPGPSWRPWPGPSPGPPANPIGTQGPSQETRAPTRGIRARGRGPLGHVQETWAQALRNKDTILQSKPSRETPRLLAETRANLSSARHLRQVGDDITADSAILLGLGLYLWKFYV